MNWEKINSTTELKAGKIIRNERNNGNFTLMTIDKVNTNKVFLDILISTEPGVIIGSIANPKTRSQLCDGKYNILHTK